MIPIVQKVFDKRRFRSDASIAIQLTTGLNDMKFTAEQIEYLERVIEMEGLRLVIIQDEVGNVWGNVRGDVRGTLLGNVWGDVRGDVRDSFLGSFAAMQV